MREHRKGSPLDRILEIFIPTVANSVSPHRPAGGNNEDNHGGHGGRTNYVILLRVLRGKNIRSFDMKKIVVVFLAVFFIAGVFAQQNKPQKHALVIGNGNYKELNDMPKFQKKPEKTRKIVKKGHLTYV